MTVRHTVLFVWNDGTTAAQVAAVTAGLDDLRTVIPNLVRYDYGPDLEINEGNVAFAIVADFATLDDYLVYRDHPAHQAFIAEVIRPIAASSTAVQYHVDG